MSPFFREIIAAVSSNKMNLVEGAPMARNCEGGALRGTLEPQNGRSNAHYSYPFSKHFINVANYKWPQMEQEINT